jgi:hypothetical protein
MHSSKKNKLVSWTLNGRALLRICRADDDVRHDGSPTGYKLNISSTALGASIEHTPAFLSFSFEPAFWVEFFGNASQPDELHLKPRAVSTSEEDDQSFDQWG